MKKIFTLTILSVLFFSISQAQTHMGIKAGVNHSRMNGDAVRSFNQLVDLSNGYVTTEGRTGFHVGGYASIPIGAGFSIEPGLYYSQKGITLRGDLNLDKLEFLGVSARASLQSHYIDMPLLLKANVAKGLQIYAGPQVSYLVKNNLHLDAGALGISVFNRNMDVTNQFNHIDVALVGGVGYKFNNGVSISAGYDHGLSRLDKNSNFKSYNRVVKVGIGFEF